MLKRMKHLMRWGLGVAVILTASTLVKAEVLVEEFSRGGVSLNWQIVNDSVMGGISNSNMDWVSDEVVRFSGRLAMENNGGFASVRSSGRMPEMAEAKAMVIRVKGDGRTYQLRLRTSTGWRVPDYSAEFTTKLGQWQTLVLPLRDFEAGWRGRAIRDAPPVDPREIRSIGILLGDKKPGGFALEIDWIKASTAGKTKA